MSVKHCPKRLICQFISSLWWVLLLSPLYKRGTWRRGLKMTCLKPCGRRAPKLGSEALQLGLGPPRWLSCKESACQCRRYGFNPWVGKFPCRRKWQPTPVLLPGKSCGQRSLVGYSPWGWQRVRHDWTTKQQHLVDPILFKWFWLIQKYQAKRFLK